MPDPIRVDSSEMKKLMGNMAKIAREVERSFPDQYDRPLEKTVSTAQGNAPRGETGELSNKIQHGVIEGKYPYVEAFSDHSAVNEFGGTHPVYGMPVYVKQEARPFLRPAVADHRDDIQKANLECVRDAARKAGYR